MYFVTTISFHAILPQMIIDRLNLFEKREIKRGVLENYSENHEKDRIVQRIFFNRYAIFPLVILIFYVNACNGLPQPLSSTPTPKAETHPTFTSSPAPVPAVKPTLGIMPKNCPSGPLLQQTFSQLGPTVGHRPVWAIGFGGPHAVFAISSSADSYTSYGWIRKIVWEVGPHVAYPVMIRGSNIRTGAPLMFDLVNNAVVSSLVLDPKNPDHPVAAAGESYLEWGSNLYIPQAGCYNLTASWPDGKWQITFSAGRQ